MLEHNEFYLSLIRHGQSEFNITPDRMGQFSDTALTHHGRRQAQLLGLRFHKENKKFHKVYSSDYIRAHDTAKLVMGDDYPMTLVPELREYSAGDWDGVSKSQTITQDILYRMNVLAAGFQPPNGESMHMVERRASRWLEDNIIYNKQLIEETSKRAADKDKPMELAIFSHGMTIKCLLHYVMGFDQGFIWKLTTENTSVCKLHFGKEGWRLLTINDHAHLL
jgi:broad specificity phosphatase PhoE